MGWNGVEEILHQLLVPSRLCDCYGMNRILPDQWSNGY